MKIGFTVDTNILIGQNATNTSLIKNLSFFLEYINALNKKDKKNILIFYISDIVKEEVIAHKKRYMKEDYDNLYKAYEKAKYLLNDELPTDNIEKTIKKEEAFSNKLNILKLNRTEDKFNKIIKCSIEKEPPFIKCNGDAGFKDALIWETILDSKEIDELDVFYFFTTDKDFDDYRLPKEFKKYHKNTNIVIEVIDNNGEKRQNVLNKIIEDNNLMHTDITKLFNEDYILQHIIKLSPETIEEKSRSIKHELQFSIFNKNDFDIDDVVEIDDKFKVVVKLNTCISIDGLCMPISGDLNLIMHKTKRDYYCESHELTNIKFGIEGLNEFIDNIRNDYNYNNEMTKLPIETMKKLLDFINVTSTIKNQLEEINKYSESFKRISNINKKYYSNIPISSKKSK